MSGTIEPNTPLLVTLQARQWNSLLSCAGEGLNAMSALIADVQRQCMQQTVATQHRGNGRDTEPAFAEMRADG
jgi:hypothetical protein